MDSHSQSTLNEIEKLMIRKQRFNSSAGESLNTLESAKVNFNLEKLK
jgi:hypothetical protein